MCYLSSAPEAAIQNQLNYVERDQPFPLEFELYFAHAKSNRWGKGGVAFVGLKQVLPAPTLGRAYLLRLSQLVEVARGENGNHSDVTTTERDLTGESPVEIAKIGRYRLLLPCGRLGGIPVVTLTGVPKETTPRNPPSMKYLKVIRAGIKETYPEMLDSAIEEYLRKASGR